MPDPRAPSERERLARSLWRTEERALPEQGTQSIIPQRSMFKKWESPTVEAAPEPPKPAPPTAEEARARLAEVVADFRDTNDRLAKLSIAHERARRDSTEAFLLVEQCEGLLAEAREGQPRAYVARILNGADGEPEDLVVKAQQRLGEANRQRDLAKQGEAIIADEVAATERRLADLRYRRRDRIKELVQASPATARLHAEWQAALLHAGAIFAALHAIDPIATTASIDGWDGTAPLMDHPRDVNRVRIKVPLGDATAWLAALAALESDAAAKLPGE